MVNTIGIDDLRDALIRQAQAVRFTGQVDAGATTTVIPIVDAAFVPDQFQDLICRFLTGDQKGQWRRIASNDATSLTLDSALPAAPASGDELLITSIGILSQDVQQWGNTPLTGRDITLDLALLQNFMPIAKATIFNTAVNANTNILGAGISPTNSPSILRVTICLNTGAVFNAQITRGGTTIAFRFNGGTALAAGAGYTFDLPWRSGDAVNFQVEAADTVCLLNADEVGAGA